MEANKTTCCTCGKVRFWTGYKTGLGKSPAQLEQMHRDRHVCRFCESTNVITEADRETETGRAYAETEDFTAHLIALFLGEKLEEE